jgi:hypothetical protein
MVFLRRVLRWLVTANVVPSSPIRVTVMIVAIGSSETWVLTRAHEVTTQKTTAKTSNLVHISIKSSHLRFGVPRGLLVGGGGVYSAHISERIPHLTSVSHTFGPITLLHFVIACDVVGKNCEVLCYTT